MAPPSGEDVFLKGGGVVLIPSAAAQLSFASQSTNSEEFLLQKIVVGKDPRSTRGHVAKGVWSGTDPVAMTTPRLTARIFGLNFSHSCVGDNPGIFTCGSGARAAGHPSHQSICPHLATWNPYLGVNAGFKITAVAKR